MNKEIEITKIKLNLGGKEVELTVEQARKLKSSLDELFGKEIIKEVFHEHYPGWWYTYSYPQYTHTVTNLPLYPTTTGGAWVSNDTLTLSAQ